MILSSVALRVIFGTEVDYRPWLAFVKNLWQKSLSTGESIFFPIMRLLLVIGEVVGGTILSPMYARSKYRTECGGMHMHTSSQSAVDNAQTSFLSQRQPLHLLHPASRTHYKALLFTCSDE